jgi:hypothetical protein
VLAINRSRYGIGVILCWRVANENDMCDIDSVDVSLQMSAYLNTAPSSPHSDLP